MSTAEELRAYQDTQGEIFKRAFGITDPDVTVRAEQIIEEHRLAHLRGYGTEVRMSLAEARAAARAELGVTVPPPVTSYEFAERMKWASPACQIGVVPEHVNTGIGARRTRADGVIEYSGDPAIVERMKAADEDRRRRQGW